jgi:hypothetical protein
VGKRNHRSYLLFVVAAVVTALLWLLIFAVYVYDVARSSGSSFIGEALGA